MIRPQTEIKARFRTDKHLRAQIKTVNGEQAQKHALECCPPNYCHLKKILLEEAVRERYPAARRTPVPGGTRELCRHR